ncbi:fumarylacetoacetate hydrolase family protein [Aurantivibrio plasticivorans]
MNQQQVFVRYELDGKTYFAEKEGDILHQLNAAPYNAPARTGTQHKVNSVQLLAPAAPSKIVCIGLNYKSHLGERPALEYPGMFAKYPSALVGNEQNVIIPSDAKSVHYEGEMVIILGKHASHVSEEEAKTCIFGVTIGNDISERVWQQNDLQWLRAKSSDTFAPMGPYLVTGLDYGNLELETRVNGEVRQASNTNLLIFNVPFLISYISRYITLNPGDAIYTGTPGTTQKMVDGDVVEVELSGVGVLRNQIVKGSAQQSS